MPTLTESEVSLNEVTEDGGTFDNERKGLIFNITPIDGARCKLILETGCDGLTLDIPIGEEFELILGEAQNEMEDKLEDVLYRLRKGNSAELIADKGNTTEIQTQSGVLSEDEHKKDKQNEVTDESQNSCSIDGSEDVQRSETQEQVAMIDDKSFTKIKVTLVDFQNPPNVCDYTHKQKLDIARYHKCKGVELFKLEKRIYAYRRFSKALKFLLLMLPRKDIAAELCEEFDLLRMQCYSNMAACLLKENQYEAAVKNCSKSLEIDEKNVKSLYRRAEAYFQLERYAECKKDVQMGLKLEPKSKVFHQLYAKLTTK